MKTLIITFHKTWINQAFISIANVFICLTMLGYSTVVHADMTLNFGVYTSDMPSTMVRKFRPVLNQLEKRLTPLLGQPVQIRLQVANSYQRGIADLVNEKVDVSRLGPASYIVAKKQAPGINIIAVESHQGTKVFNGVISVAQDSPIQNEKDLIGKRFAFGNQNSTIGRFLAQQYLLKHGIGAKELGTYEYLDRHDKVGMAVANGLFDAGALKESTFLKLIKKGKKLRSIAVFPNVTKPWVAKNHLPKNIFIALQQALLGFDPTGSLTQLGKTSFLKGADEDYSEVRTAIDQNFLFFE